MDRSRFALKFKKHGLTNAIQMSSVFLYDMHFIHLEQKTQGTPVASESDCNLKAQASCFKKSMLKKIDVTIDITTRGCYIVLVR